MPFQKGFSGNKNGRPVGAINRTGLQLRETIAAFLESNFRKIVIDFKKLPPKERAKLYCDLLQYAVPRLQSVSNEMAIEIKGNDIDYSKLSDQALNEIIAASNNSKTFLDF